LSKERRLIISSSPLGYGWDSEVAVGKDAPGSNKIPGLIGEC